MSSGAFDPPFTPVDRVVPALRQDGYAVLSPQGVAAWLGCPLAQLELLHADWNQLPLDEYLKDGGRYRTRRHACFTVEDAIIEQVPHRAHWQPVEYNALHGGMQHFELRERAAQPLGHALRAQHRVAVLAQCRNEPVKGCEGRVEVPCAHSDTFTPFQKATRSRTISASGLGSA